MNNQKETSEGRVRKAWALSLIGGDTNEENIAYFPTAGKAKYDLITDLDWWDNMSDAFKSVKCRRAKYADVILPERMPECDDLFPEQIKIIKHTYAAEHKNMGYRNYYSCNINNEFLMDLVAKKIMNEPVLHKELSPDATFHLSDYGIEMAKSLAPLYPLYGG